MSEEKDLRAGVAVGGPFDGQILESRFPSGVLAVSAPEGLAWVYDRVDTPDGHQYEVRGDPAGLDQAKLRKAAEGNTYDVRAVDDAEVTEEVGR